MDHFQLICDIGEINQVFTDSQSIESFLQKIVDLVARHMATAVCSIYLYEEITSELVLNATHGLNPDSVGKVRLKPGEGLVGLSLKENKIINERIGKLHPNFKPFPGISEEKFDSFLAVPILRGVLKIGVLVIQREGSKAYSDSDIIVLRAVTSQMANMLELARLFITMQTARKPFTDSNKTAVPQLLKGKVASEGFAMGPARIVDRNKTFECFSKKTFSKRYGLDDFLNAITETELQLETLQKQVEEKLSDVASLIFTAHLLLLKDKEFVGSMQRKIEEGSEVPDAIISVAKHYIDIFSRGSNFYIREKVQDIEDLSIRLLGNLVPELKAEYQCSDHIIISTELFPSDMLKISSENALGIILVTGGTTSHLSILARSLGLPLVIIDSPVLLSIPDETLLLLDAEIGNLHINPSKTVTGQFIARNEGRKNAALKMSSVLPETCTRDGKRIRLYASINLLSDLKLATDVKCEGIGLYRTEFPFLIRNNFPSEEEQFVIYRRLVEGMRGSIITFRTLDIGGDKVLSYFDLPKEQNPFLGMRSIRFSLSNRELFDQQIRAMLRAGAGAQIRIMFPLISMLEEFLEAKQAVYEGIDHLRREHISCNESPSVGIMVEVPSVLSIINELAQVADFFSIGTNDLVQYLLAVDRTNEKVANLFIQHHPSVLRAIKLVADTANRNGKCVSICGDMATQERYIPFFIGTGITELSIEPASLPKIQEIIQKIDSCEAHRLAESIVSTGSIAEIERLLQGVI
jgi:phosphotransferase system enzyme I (PtsP)